MRTKGRACKKICVLDVVPETPLSVEGVDGPEVRSLGLSDRRFVGTPYERDDVVDTTIGSPKLKTVCSVVESLVAPVCRQLSEGSSCCTTSFYDLQFQHSANPLPSVDSESSRFYDSLPVGIVFGESLKGASNVLNPLKRKAEAAHDSLLEEERQTCKPRLDAIDSGGCSVLQSDERPKNVLKRKAHHVDTCPSVFSNLVSAQSDGLGNADSHLHSYATSDILPFSKRRSVPVEQDLQHSHEKGISVSAQTSECSDVRVPSHFRGETSCHSVVLDFQAGTMRSPVDVDTSDRLELPIANVGDFHSCEMQLFFPENVERAIRTPVMLDFESRTVLNSCGGRSFNTGGADSVSRTNTPSKTGTSFNTRGSYFVRSRSIPSATVRLRRA